MKSINRDNNYFKDTTMTPRSLLASLLLLISLPVSTALFARTLGGITIPETVQVGDKQLQLNGAGVRSKFVFDIYVGALYLAQKTSSAQAIINDPGPKQVSMYFVYSEISQEKMINGWNEGFDNVLDAVQREKLKTQITSFNQAFGKTFAGDVIDVVYSPEHGTQVIVNKETRATIPGFDFHQAVMKVWLGDKPVDADLKQGMLGKSTSE